MTVNQLLNLFYNYVVSNKLLTTASANQYRYNYLPNLPFGIIDSTLNLWITYRGKSGKNYTSKYYESFNGLTPQPPVPNTECSLKNHRLYKYYEANIRGKNTTIATPAGYDYLQLIADFLDDGDLVYALTIVDIVLGIAEKANSQLPRGGGIKALSDGIAALKKLRIWLEFDKSLVQNVNPHSSLHSERKKIKIELIHKIDGAVALAREIGVDNFIQYAIDQCFFFEPKIVNDRMKDICDCVKSILYLYARKSTSFFMNTTVYNINSHGKYGQIGDGLNDATFKSRVNSENLSRIVLGLKEITVNSDTKHRLFTDPDPTYNITNYPIILDTDGNRELRSIINVDYTGYTISSGKDSIFQNYRISHVWGRAFDPRFFTNLWNVVLVPAWANDLLDKPNPVEGSLESKLKSTIQRICEVLYFGGIKNWSSINITQPSVINGGNDVVRPKSMANDVAPKKVINEENATKSKNAPKNPLPYLINIIEGKGSKTLGDIVKYAVYI